MKSPHLFRLAWRDGWGARQSFLWPAICLLVATFCFHILHHISLEIENTMTAQTREISGGDLDFVSPQAITLQQTQVVEKLLSQENISIYATADTIEFLSMLMPLDDQGENHGHARLVEVHAVSTSFPLYGTLQSRTPQGMGASKDNEPSVSLTPDLHTLLGANKVRLGRTIFGINSEILNEPGGNLSPFPIAPHIWIAKTDVEKTGLLQTGSRVRYKHLLRLDHVPDSSVVERLKNAIKDDRIQIHTATTSSSQIEKLFERVFRFSRLSSLLAMTLAMLAASVGLRLVHAEQERTQQTLHILGLSPTEVSRWRLIQTALLLFSSSAVGWVIATLLEPWLATFLISRFHLALRSEILLSQEFQTLALYAVLLGSLMTFNLARGFTVRALSIFLTLATTILLVGDWRWGAGYWIVVFAVLQIFRVLIKQSLKLIDHHLASQKPSTIVAPTWFVAARVRLLSLVRFPNVTAEGISGVGLGVFLVFGILIFRDSLVTELQAANSAQAPELFLIDVGTDQKDAIENLLATLQTHAEWSRFVKARLVSVNGKPPLEVPEEERLHREFNLNDRPELDASESIVAGHWWTGRAAEDAKLLEASVEVDFGKRMGLKLGDHVQFDLQGVAFDTVIVNTRRVDWTSFHPNFFFLIQPGFLDSAPQTWVAALAKSRRPEISNLQIQDEIVQHAANVTVIDIAQTLSRIKSLMRSIEVVITFLAILILVAGFLLLSSSLLELARIRKNETALLRALGCSPGDLARSHQIEGVAWAALILVFAIPLSTITMMVVIARVFQGTATLGTADQWYLIFGFIVIVFIISGTTQKRARAEAPSALLRNS